MTRARKKVFVTIVWKVVNFNMLILLTRKAFQLPIQMAENFYIILKDLMQVAYW